VDSATPRLTMTGNVPMSHDRFGHGVDAAGHDMQLKAKINLGVGVCGRQT
jgi:hypothetical protein